MSLLLDALKKAAEQKAEKEGKLSPDGAASAETPVQDETQTELVEDHEATEILQDIEQGNKEDTYLDQEQTEAITLKSDDYGDLDEKTEVVTEDTEVVTEDTEVVIFDSNDYSDLGEDTIQNIFDEDQTMVLTDIDVSNFMGDDESSPAEAENEAPDTDLSLHLNDEESTTSLSYEGPKTGSLAADTRVQILADSQATTNQLNLEGVPEQHPDDQDRTVTLTPDHTATTGVNLDGLTSTRGPGLQDQTSTRTFAPDNYDRTLAKVANDDATGLFAGMKSDTGLVMTPEHAKKVFVSKFSARRMYHYRIYSAVAFSILLVIGILGMFELQQKSFDIDTSLRPLKRDPMPGVIKIVSDQEPSTNLLAEATQPVVDTLTLQLVENAEITGNTEIAVPEEVEIVRISEPRPEPDPQSEPTAAQSPEGEIIDSSILVSQPVVAIVEPVKEVNTDTSASDLDEAPNQQLQISTRSTISDKDRWLGEAYASYQRGDDKTALARYNQVIEVDPGNRNALLARAAIYIQDNNAEAAIRDYQALLLANPKDSLAMASLMAVANYSPEVAESHLKIMMREEPDSPYLNFALANVYGAQDRWIEAQGLYFTALKHNPNDPNYAYNLAVSLEHIEKPEVAIAYYERALDNFNNGLATFNRDVVDQRLEKLKQL
ncbi:MAG: tetratricopeptide repeat protein [Gammaproteobacteria bacterium]